MMMPFIKQNKSRLLYKITTQDNKTRKNLSNETTWGEGVTHEVGDILLSDYENKLCTRAYIHAYENPCIAVLMNCQHANIEYPKLWLAEGFGDMLCDGDLKCGVKKLTTIKQIDFPIISDEQKIEIAIHSVMTAYRDIVDGFTELCKAWLNGETLRCVDKICELIGVMIGRTEHEILKRHSELDKNGMFGDPFAAASNEHRYHSALCAAREVVRIINSLPSKIYPIALEEMVARVISNSRDSNPDFLLEPVIRKVMEEQ